MDVSGQSGAFAGQKISLTGGRLVFGRSRGECDVVFPDNTKGISRRHCKVEICGNGVMITDLGSSYGTFVNGRKIPPNTPTSISPGDSFWLGDKSNSFSISGANQGGSLAQSGFPAIAFADKTKQKRLILISAAVVAAVLFLIAGIVFFVNKGKNDSLVGTWKVAEEPGMRMTFAENGDLIVTENGEYKINGELTYSSAGDRMVSVKYTEPENLDTITTNGGLNLFGVFSVGAEGGSSVYSQYSSGYIWKYKYDAKEKAMIIYDINDYKLFSLEKVE